MIIEAQLGFEVAEYVRACSDSTASPKPPWRARKEAFIGQIRGMAPEAKLIVAADKLHNTLSLLRDYRQVGEALWERFNGGRDGTLWYYPTVTQALEASWAHPILVELRNAVDGLLALASERGTRPRL